MSPLRRIITQQYGCEQRQQGEASRCCARIHSEPAPVTCANAGTVGIFSLQGDLCKIRTPKPQS